MADRIDKIEKASNLEGERFKEHFKVISIAVFFRECEENGDVWVF